MGEADLVTMQVTTMQIRKFGYDSYTGSTADRLATMTQKDILVVTHACRSGNSSATTVTQCVQIR